MKKPLFACVLIAFSVLFLLSGCGDRPAVSSPEEDKLTVYATFYPLYDFAVRIGGERVDVITMVPGGVEPHEWEPGPQMLTALSRADLLVYNGLGMEPWLDKVTESLDMGAVMVNTSQGIEPLTGYRGHSHDDEDDHDDENDYDDEDDHGDELPDPHIWLDPLLALHQAERIAEALSALDEANRDYYLENLADFRNDIENLDWAFREAFSSVGKRKFVVTHLSFAYLAERYGLEQIGIAGLSPHAEPTPAQMRDLVDFANAHEIRYVFKEPLASSRLAEVLATEINGEILGLNPLEGLTEQEISAGEDYFSLMYWNLEQLKTALSE